jgi:CRP/FNR family transcriptional regulator, cyclic AMP receptor protein
MSCSQFCFNCSNKENNKTCCHQKFGVGTVLRITQQELAYLVGLSRQRVNEALSTLPDQGTIKVEYAGLRVLDIHAIRTRNF